MAFNILLCLGSNMAKDAELNIDKALTAIEQRIGHVAASSGKYSTPCYHQGRPVEGASYLNEVIEVVSDADAAYIESICKDIERTLGRNELSRRQNIVPIDIDLVVHEGAIIRAMDYNSPYFIKGYKKMMKNEISALTQAWGVKPDQSCDMAQWQEQYEKCPELWDQLFAYLAHTDISTLEPGKVVLAPERLWINVMAYTPKDFDSTPAEAHKKYIDLQYTLSGDEMMGLVTGGVEVTIPYSETKDVEKYRPTGAVQFTKATSDRFFLYFPSDIHQPSVATSDTPALSHKIVCKIQYLP